MATSSHTGRPGGRLLQHPAASRRRRRTLGQLLLALGVLFGVVGAMLPANAVPDPNVSGDGWSSTWPGFWPPNGNDSWDDYLPAANPTLDPACGIDIGVIIDRSGSIADEGEATNYKNGVKALIDEFAGTPSKIGLWSFGSKASDTNPGDYPWHQMVDVDVPANVTSLKDLIDDDLDIVSNVSTNWEEGLRAPLQASSLAVPKPDLMVVVTDGQPTVHADDSGSGGTVNNADMAGGILSANLLKAAGIRVLAVGVGDGVAVNGLRTISGDTPFDGSNIDEADYLTTSFDDLATSLREFATAVCGSAVTVTKLASTTEAPNTFAPAAGWAFAGTLASPPPSVFSTPDDGITGADGEVTFQWTSVAQETATITEAPQEGFTLLPVTCVDEDDVAFTDFTAVPNGIQVTLDPTERIQCEFRNQAAGFVDLAVEKDDGLVTADPGDTLTYDIDYENLGSVGATGVVLSETVPVGTTFHAAGSTPGWTCADGALAGTTCELAIGNLAAGGSGSAAFAVTIASPVPAGTTVIDNTVSIDGNEDETNTDNNTDDDETSVVGVIDLYVDKVDDPTSTTSGGTITYDIAYGNKALATTTATDVVLTETVPAHTTYVAAGSSAWSCADGAAAGSTCALAVGSLAPGDDGVATFVVEVVDPLPAGVTVIDNTITIGGTGTELDPSDNSDDEDTPLTTRLDLEVTKTDGGVSTVPGGTVQYTIGYRNVGNQIASGVVLTETVPAHTTFNVASSTLGWICVPDGDAGSTCTIAIGNLAPSAGYASVTFAVNVVDPLPAGVTEIENTVEISGTNETDPPGDLPNKAGDTTPVDAAPQLEVLKTDNAATVAPGDELTYTISYRNTGNQTATGVTLAEIVPEHTTFVGPAGWSCAEILPTIVGCTYAIGDLPVSDVYSTLTFTVVVDDPLTEQVDELYNTVDINSDDCQGPCDTDDEETPVEAEPVLTVQKDDGGVSTTPGGTVTYDIDYANEGDEPATGVVLTETVPAHTTFAGPAAWSCSVGDPAGTVCTIAVGTLAAGATGSVEFSVQVLNPVPAGVDLVVNTVSIDDDDPEVPGDSDTDDTPLDADPDLTVDKDDAGVTVAPGGTISYTIDYANEGDEGATGVVLSETVPADTTFVGPAAWSCELGDPAGTVCTLAVGDLAGGASGSTTFVVQVDDTVPAGVEVIDNTVSIDDDVCVTSCDEDDEDTPLDAAPDLIVTKDDGGITAEEGDEVTYTIVYANVGDQDATGVVLTETVPSGSTFVGPDDWTCVVDTCTVEIGDLAAGDSGEIDFTVLVAPVAEGQTELDNVVVIADDGENGDDPTPEDNADTDDTPLLRPTEVEPNVIVPPAPPEEVKGSVTLPTTGAETNQLVLLAGLSMVLGGILLVSESLTAGRRRRSALRSR
ncbi:MAG: VWA domain-containing protein [Acidimicrobiales bacterium]